jgi:MFS transporter, UMF1 family
MNASPVWVDSSDIGGADNKWHIRREVVAAWKRLGGMLQWQEIKRLRNTFKYLAAWFLLSDG